MLNDYLIESNILFWYRKSKFLVWNCYPLDAKRNFHSRVNDFSRTKSNNFMLIPIYFLNWSLINLVPKWNFFLMEMISFCYKGIFFLKVAKFRYLLKNFESKIKRNILLWEINYFDLKWKFFWACFDDSILFTCDIWRISICPVVVPYSSAVLIFLGAHLTDAFFLAHFRTENLDFRY